jgi:hypothetical protein
MMKCKRNTILAEAPEANSMKSMLKGTSVILLDPDIAEVFKDSDSVNRALRALVELAKNEMPQPQ